MHVSFIERSPDHWWVTTGKQQFYTWLFTLKGHQIIGELRLYPTSSRIISGDWKVTRSLVSYDHCLPEAFLQPFDWKVTRSLVSYDYSLRRAAPITNIERSPDHWWVTTAFSDSVITFAKDWKVTRSLVSYDYLLCNSESIWVIERSPDHWWVTT